MDIKIKHKIAEELRTLADAVEEVQYIQKYEYEYEFSVIVNGYAETQIKPILDIEKDYKGAKYLYTFEADENVDIEKCFEKFKYAKENKIKDRSYARLQSQSKVFYVGTSKSLSTRLKQHFGYAAPSIYSMQLCHWLQGIEGRLKLIIYKFSQSIEPEVLQALEDGTWKVKAPMFGRKGAR